MKINQMLIALILMVMVSSCNDDSALSSLRGKSGLSYKESFGKWNSLKQKNGNSYAYKSTLSSWIGIEGVTEIHVENGVVISRKYQQFRIDENTGEKSIVDSYTETNENLGSHENGAKPLTVDDLYNSCAKEYLIVDTDQNTLYFEAELDGMMTLCGFVPNDCMDDCFRGVKINSFRWLD